MLPECCHNSLHIWNLWLSSQLLPQKLPHCKFSFPVFCPYFVPAIGWDFSWAISQNIYTWPLHMVFHLGQFGLLHKMGSSKGNKMEVHGIFMTSPHTAPLLPSFIGHGSHEGLPRFKGRENRPHHLIGRVSPHCKKNVWDGICCVSHLWKL